LILGADFSPLEVGMAILVALAVEGGSLWMLRTGGGTPLHADISDERSRPISVAITPVVDDAPLLKLGSKIDPRKLPDRWVAPRPVERATPAAFPSPAAQHTPAAIPTTRVADAGQKPPSPTADLIKEVDLSVAMPEAGPSPVSTVQGAADGVKEGTETDPLKAHAVSLYKQKLNDWFSSRFPIRGKIPFETLKTLHATVSITFGSDRTVASFRMTNPSGNAVFDDTLHSSLSNIQSSGIEVPPPPPMYPDILGESRAFFFNCKDRSRCE
jgi:hypothetical protein